MIQSKFKWKCLFFLFVFLFNIGVNSLPEIDNNNSEFPAVTKLINDNKEVNTAEEAVNATRDGLFRQNVRPGQAIRSYSLEITVNENTVNGNTFDGRAVLNIVLTPTTRADDIILHAKDLIINSVKVGVFSITNVFDAEFEVDYEELYIYPPIVSSSYVVIIEYTGNLADGGLGLRLGRYNKDTYVAMNLNPTYARRVFPCMDEPTEVSIISFRFNNLDYTHIESNSLLEENSVNQFRPMFLPPHLWGMIAHNFVIINIPAASVRLFGRHGIRNQDTQASIAINSFYNNLNEWTRKPYIGIDLNQNGNMNIMALPDVSTDWNALSIVGIWEPYVFMETTNSVKQRSLALPKIAEAMAKQWFGFVIFPQNWRYEWVVSGLASYAGWEIMREFYGGVSPESELDVNTLFVTEVIQESLLRDSYLSSGELEPYQDLFDEVTIRDHIGVNGVQKYKAPALMRMMRNVLGDKNVDFIQLAASVLVNSMSLGTVNTLNFVDAVNSVWLGSSHAPHYFHDFLEPWQYDKGYPLLQVVQITNSLVLIYQEVFGFNVDVRFGRFKVPVTYTTSTELNFGEEKLFPISVSDSVQLLPIHLGDNDWVLFNIQGQGYYRVNYSLDLWEKIIKALETPLTRNQIHPLNRATLIDDALNIARAGRLQYEVALRIILTMQHETEFAPWKAFVRNLNFLRKRLTAYVDGAEDLDKDIYLRIINQTIPAFEEYIGFYPDVLTSEPAMQSLTRGLVMDHACRANYQPCVAAAKDWFYNPHNNKEVNPKIPHDIRPAVYCTMVRQGDRKVIEALEARLDIEPTLYERVVILESLACSQGETFINELLYRTIAGNSPYGVEERLKIFATVAESSSANANLALRFMRIETTKIKRMYGGPEKLEEAIFILADNMVTEDLSEDFDIWVASQNNTLGESQVAANRAVVQVHENLHWNMKFKEELYDLITEYTSQFCEHLI